ncbi:endoglin-like [Tubulanus polymorphus]|uniref:endoglin-like n=1 Tax=Tubulanus polymorphus TaxID=672921 RepID=UPI003DA36BDF
MPFLTDPSKGVFGGQSIGGGNKFPRGPMGNQNNRSPHGENSGQGNLDQTGPIIVQGLDSGTVVGIAFAAFIIGVLLTASLWFIHTHTGPSRKKNKVKNRRRGESSGESTPSSTVPMAV